MISPLCLIRQLWGLRSYLSPAAWYRAVMGNPLALATVGGHVLQDVEVHAGCTVYVSRCIDCGAQSLTWKHGPPDRSEEVAGECRCHPARNFCTEIAE
jgi:hypothetical protein